MNMRAKQEATIKSGSIGQALVRLNLPHEFCFRAWLSTERSQENLWPEHTGLPSRPLHRSTHAMRVLSRFPEKGSFRLSRIGARNLLMLCGEVLSGLSIFARDCPSVYTQVPQVDFLF
jgi:hypothetical protein